MRLVSERKIPLLTSNQLLTVFPFPDKHQSFSQDSPSDSETVGYFRRSDKHATSWQRRPFKGSDMGH